jgi:hypothetical protein
MQNSKNFYRDITTGIFFFSGIFCFMSGGFVLSTALFGTACLVSNLNFETEMLVNS